MSATAPTPAADDSHTQAYDGPPVDVPAADAPAGFVLEKEIGRGGMGMVYRAYDTKLRRDLAVKVLRTDHPRMRKRFLEEVQIAGQLQHPGVAPVHDVGALPDGRPYFTMKLVRGRTFSSLLKERPDPAHELPRFLGIFEQVCQAMAYAHSKGVIHRDLKPSNVMVGAFGEVQVMDWGLAKVLPSGGRQPPEPPSAESPPPMSVAESPRGDSDDQTQAGSMLGTPGYAAPEQARGSIHLLDQRADVFGLGAILCELLTGQPVFVGDADTIRDRAIRGDLSNALSRLDGCGADGELVSLAKHCLAPEPADRPADAGKVAAAVATYLAGAQQKLRRAELSAAEGRVRRRWWRVLAAALLIGTAAALGLAVWALQEKDKARVAEGNAVREAENACTQEGQARSSEARAKEQEDAARKESARARRLLGLMNVNNGVRAADAGDLFGGLLWFAEPLVRDPDNPQAEEMARYRIAAYRHGETPTLCLMLFHGGGVWSATFSPGGRRIATVSNTSNTARIWDAQTGQPLTPPSDTRGVAW